MSKGTGFQAEKCSPREREVIEKVLEGLPNKVIAEQLFITEQTVKFHCSNIFKKLNIPNRTALFVQSMQLELS